MTPGCAAGAAEHAVAAGAQVGDERDGRVVVDRDLAERAERAGGDAGAVRGGLTGKGDGVKAGGACEEDVPGEGAAEDLGAEGGLAAVVEDGLLADEAERPAAGGGLAGADQGVGAGAGGAGHDDACQHQCQAQADRRRAVRNRMCSPTMAPAVGRERAGGHSGDQA